MLRSVSLWVLIGIAAAAPASARQEPAALSSSIDSLSSFDYSTRMNAARMLRRAPLESVVPALVMAARTHADEFVRYRALIVLTSFNDRGTPDLMRSLLGDRNDRIREVVYRWFERNPNPELSFALLAALESEQSEFVRPALVRAVAALPGEDAVRRALLAETARGFDFFRTAVIEALGEHKAAYAIDTLIPFTQEDGAFQDDAILALGRIGDRRALEPLATLKNPPPAIVPVVQASQCLLGDSCPDRIQWLAQAVRNPAARADQARAAIASLGVVGEANPAALGVLLTLGDEKAALRDYVALALSGTALREPRPFVEWLGGLDETERARAIALLRDAFQSLEEDFAEEQFFAAARAAYWGSAEGSPTRTMIAGVIDKLEF